MYEAYAARVRGLALRYLFDRDAVDDVVQETLLRAYRAGLHVEDDRDPWPWLASVARNLCRDAARRRARTPDHGVDVERVLTLVPGPDVIVEDAARARHVTKTLAALAPHQRELLVRHHVEEVPCGDLADDHGMSVDAVKTALLRARSAFRSTYDGWRGVIPGWLSAAGATVRDRVRSWMTATTNLPSPIKPGLAGVLVALFAFGGIPSASGDAAAPSDDDAPPNSPLDIDVGVVTASPTETAGGRLITFQPPESPDALPTPALPTAPSARPKTGEAPGGPPAGASPASEIDAPLVDPLGVLPSAPLPPDVDPDRAIADAVAAVAGVASGVADQVAASVPPATVPDASLPL